MRRLRTGHLEKFVTFVLAVSVSVCCCQAHFLLHGFGGPEPELANSVAVEAAGCCSNCTIDAQGDAQGGTQGGERPAAPPKTCKSCCVKGTGLKDGIKLVALDLADVLLTMVEAPAIALTPSALVAPRLPAPPPYVAPRTLVRLHCALIV